MSNVNKMEMALRIIAGITPAWGGRPPVASLFGDELVPPRGDKHEESMPMYQSRISVKVRLEACRYVADRLNALTGGQ